MVFEQNQPKTEVYKCPLNTNLVHSPNEWNNYFFFPVLTLGCCFVMSLTLGCCSVMSLACNSTISRCHGVQTWYHYLQVKVFFHYPIGFLIVFICLFSTWFAIKGLFQFNHIQMVLDGLLWILFLNTWLYATIFFFVRNLLLLHWPI